MNDLNIVLFGLPAAGKTSLLGALAQAAQTQERLLNGRLVDASHRLDDLQRRLDEGNATSPSAPEVVSYPVDFEPFSVDSRNPKAQQHFGAVFLDGAGCAASELLEQQQGSTEDSSEGTLARAVHDADALVLVIDASASPAQVESNFAEFERFLQRMETSRGQRVEVNGLPVFLVLNKCDLLAMTGDTAADWMERIEHHKRDLNKRFRYFLDKKEQEWGQLPFGRIDLHLWATAVKRPMLVGSAAQAREPYGVAELFRQCLERASAFRRRRQLAGRRLVWTVGASAGILALMASLALVFTIHNLDTPLNALRERVQIWRSTDLPTEEERLKAPLRELRSRVEELRDIRNDPHFAALSAQQQHLVCDRLDELEAYLSYFDCLVQSRRPRDVHNMKTLLEIKHALKTELALPKEAWKDTEAGRLQADRLQDAEALSVAVKRTEDWYRDSAAKTEQLRTFSRQQTERGAPGINWDQWTANVETLLRPDFRPPYSSRSPVPGSTTTLTYEATVLRFDEVIMARSDWEEKRGRLQRVFDLCTALGLVSPAAFPQGAKAQGLGILAIPRHFSLSQCRERRNQLELSYSNYKRDFSFENVPEAIRPVVDQIAHTSYERLLAPALDVVRKQLEQGGGVEETAARWDNVRRWLRGPKELEDWRVLAGALIRLRDPAGTGAPDATDPVSSLAEFLERKSFTLNIRRVVLEVPEIPERKLNADSLFSIYHPTSAGDKPALVLQVSGEGERDPQRRVWIYTFRLREAQTLLYRPGDALWASLPLRDGWTFTWQCARGSMYQFECLSQPPRLHQSKETAAGGTREEAVRLMVLPSDGLPRLPDLMPTVRP